MRRIHAVLLVLILAGCGGGDSGGIRLDESADSPVNVPDTTSNADRANEPSGAVVRDGRLPFPITDIHAGAPSVLIMAFEGRRDKTGKSYEAPEPPRRASPHDALHSPMTLSARLADNRYEEPVVFVGIDQGVSDWGFVAGVQQTRESIANLPVVDRSPELDVRYGRLDDGAGTQTLRDYFAEFFSDAASRYLADPNVQNRALRFRTAPEVRIIGRPTERDIQEAVAAVQLVNAALPEAVKLRFGPSMPDTSFQDASGTTNVQKVPDDMIAVEFWDASSAYETDGSRTQGTSYASNDFRQDGSIRASYVRIGIESAGPTAPTRQEMAGTIAHELVHALGIYGHVDPFRFRSLMNHFGSKGILWPTDREALRFLYGRVQPGDLRPFAFGSWASESLHIHGNGPYVGFGIVMRNGYAEPWAYGDLPDRNLRDNRALSGSVSWTGTLLGLTPLAASVRGDARISVDLGTMTGLADFTRIETWTATPGTAGTGTMWGDGDLNYSISVRDNTFRDAGGDLGRLTGTFMGINHEGAGGTLVRADLTAAFGATRD